MAHTLERPLLLLSLLGQSSYNQLQPRFLLLIGGDDILSDARRLLWMQKNNKVTRIPHPGIPPSSKTLSFDIKLR